MFEVEAVGSILSIGSTFVGFVKCLRERSVRTEKKLSGASNERLLLPSRLPPSPGQHTLQNTAGIMTVALLNHLLAHHLATNDSVQSSAEYVLSVLRNEKAISTCETEEGLGGPVLHRSVA